MLVREVVDVFERYVGFLADPARNARDITLWSSVVVVVFQELINMDGWWASRRGDKVQEEEQKPCLGLKKQLAHFFRYGIRIMTSERAEIRQALQAFLHLIADEIEMGQGFLQK